MLLRRSVLTDASLALSLVAANFGIAMAARMPMITTTISSSISVKPFRLNMRPPLRVNDASPGGGPQGSAKALMCGVHYEIARIRSEEHTTELQSPCNLVCRLL